MKKVALLIGISEYELGLQPLPKAVNDVDAVHRVLVNPEMGDFAQGDVTVLKNPERQVMSEKIEELYSNCQKDDLVLFYFSGHGITIDTGEFYFSTRITKKNDQGKLRTASAIAAKEIHSWMNQSKLILDCCFSGAFAKGLTTKDCGTIELDKFLGGEGRVILTASSSTQYAFESDGLELSVYTHYLVEGIEKGAADRDGDGLIAVDELHNYAKNKVKEAAPAMTPELYAFKEGFRIFLAKSPQDDPVLKYRKQFEQIAIEDEGEVSSINRYYLDELRDHLGLLVDQTEIIEFEILEPYCQRQQKVQKYQQALSQIREYPISDRHRYGLKRLQNILDLRDEDIEAIEQRVLAGKKAEYKRQQKESKLEVQPTREPSQLKIEDFRENLGDGVFLEMVAIPGGEFLMGSPENELGRRDSESPQHKVIVPPFFMGKFPVTQAEWKRVAVLPKVKHDLKIDPSVFKGDKRPVECVSWNDAVEFCDRLSQHTNQQYRLPSEAEWEYACRAGTTTPFYFGETITSELANYNNSSGQTTEVGSFPSNAFGLYDMHGNVWEWCQDTWHNSYEGAPSDGSAWVDNVNRVIRGGAWNYVARSCRSACRINFIPDARSDFDIGFRVVCVAART